MNKTYYEILREILVSPAGSLGVGIGVVAFLVFIAYKAGSIVNKFKVVNVIQNTIDKIKDDISEIKAFIQVFRQANNPLAKSKSPISLTDLGEKVANDINAERAINNEWKNLRIKIKKELKDEDNPYDIQQICFSLGEKYSKIISDNDFDFIKKYAYEKGYDLSIFDLLFGILIRDKYFSEEDMNVKDIDLHDPDKNLKKGQNELI